MEFIEENKLSNFNTIKTKEIFKLIANFNFLPSSKILFILSKPNKNFWLSSKNLKNIEVTTASCLNLKQLLNAKHIVLSEQSLDVINLTFGKQYE